MLGEIINRAKAFLARPFSADMDVTGWFLFFGLLIVISIAWGLILKHLKGLT